MPDIRVETVLSLWLRRRYGHVMDTSHPRLIRVTVVSHPCLVRVMHSTNRTSCGTRIGIDAEPVQEAEDDAEGTSANTS